MLWWCCIFLATSWCIKWLGFGLQGKLEFRIECERETSSEREGGREGGADAWYYTRHRTGITLAVALFYTCPPLSMFQPICSPVSGSACHPCTLDSLTHSLTH